MHTKKFIGQLTKEAQRAKRRKKEQDNDELLQSKLQPKKLLWNR